MRDPDSEFIIFFPDGELWDQLGIEALAGIRISDASSEEIDIPWLENLPLKQHKNDQTEDDNTE